MSMQFYHQHLMYTLHMWMFRCYFSPKNFNITILKFRASRLCRYKLDVSTDHFSICRPNGQKGQTSCPIDQSFHQTNFPQKFNTNVTSQMMVWWFSHACSPVADFIINPFSSHRHSSSPSLSSPVWSGLVSPSRPGCNYGEFVIYHF